MKPQLQAKEKIYLPHGETIQQDEIIVMMNQKITEDLIKKGLVKKTTPFYRLRKKIKQNFPELWKETEACLSAIIAKQLKEYNDPLTLILIGAASSGKTTVLSFFYDAPCEIFKSDNFTPRSFVSHAANVKSDKLKEIDLLPKIKDKTLISPELAPIFGKGKEDLIENFSILARILDGEGFESDSGSKGHRGYKGDYRFTWLGATTPLDKSAWDTMSKIGHRILFCKMDTIEKKEDDYITNFLHEKPYKKKIQEIREIMNELLEVIHYEHGGGYYTIDWNDAGDEEQFRQIIRVAMLVRLLRAKVSIWSEKDQDGQTVFNHSRALPESPERLISGLYNLARGRALLHDRKQLNEEDIELVYRVGLSSMPFDKCDLFLKLLKNNGVLTTKQVEEQLLVTTPTARKIMQSFAVLGVVDESWEDLSTKKVSAIQLKKEFRWILKDKRAFNIFEELRNAELSAQKECEKDN